MDWNLLFLIFLELGLSYDPLSLCHLSCDRTAAVDRKVWNFFSFYIVQPPKILEMKGHIFNIDNGYLEGLCRGFKNGILKQADYLNLVQCETLDGKILLKKENVGVFLHHVMFQIWSYICKALTTVISWLTSPAHSKSAKLMTIWKKNWWRSSSICVIMP